MGVFINFTRFTERVLVKNFTIFWCVIGKKIFHLFSKLNMVLGAHVIMCMVEPDFLKKILSQK